MNIILSRNLYHLHYLIHQVLNVHQCIRITAHLGVQFHGEYPFPASFYGVINALPCLHHGIQSGRGSAGGSLADIAAPSPAFTVAKKDAEVVGVAADIVPVIVAESIAERIVGVHVDTALPNVAVLIAKPDGIPIPG